MDSLRSDRWRGPKGLSCVLTWPRSRNRAANLSASLQIAHVNLARGYRGGECQTELLIRGLAKHGVRQVLIARHMNPLLSRLDDVDVEIRARSSNLLAAFRATRGVDLVQAHEGRGVYAAWARHAFSGTPYVITRRISKTLGSADSTYKGPLRQDRNR